MADKGESMKIMKFVKTGLKVLLEIVLEVKSLNMSPFTLKSWKNHFCMSSLFSIFFEN